MFGAGCWVHFFVGKTWVHKSHGATDERVLGDLFHEDLISYYVWFSTDVGLSTGVAKAHLNQTAGVIRGKCGVNISL